MATTEWKFDGEKIVLNDNFKESKIILDHVRSVYELTLNITVTRDGVSVFGIYTVIAATVNDISSVSASIDVRGN